MEIGETIGISLLACMKLRIHFGPGTGFYFALDGGELVVLLAAVINLGKSEYRDSP